MSTDLVTTLDSLPVSKYATPDAMAAVAAGGTWLPRLQLFIASSNLCKAGSFTPNRYGLVRSRTVIDDLSKSVNVLPLSWRPKATDINEKVNYFDPSKPEFREIQSRASSFGNGCMVGPEFLLWVPVSGVFATFYMNSITAQGEAPGLAKRIGRPATLRVQIISHKKYGPYGAPLVTDCSEQLNAPNLEELKIQLERFNNPKESELEMVDENDSGRVH